MGVAKRSSRLYLPWQRRAHSRRRRSHRDRLRSDLSRLQSLRAALTAESPGCGEGDLGCDRRALLALPDHLGASIAIEESQGALKPEVQQEQEAKSRALRECAEPAGQPCFGQDDVLGVHHGRPEQPRHVRQPIAGDAAGPHVPKARDVRAAPGAGGAGATAGGGGGGAEVSAVQRCPYAWRHRRRWLDVRYDSAEPAEHRSCPAL